MCRLAQRQSHTARLRRGEGCAGGRNDATDTKLTELLGIRHPVLLAPMGGTAGGSLAAAVSRAGGLGLIGGGDSMSIGPELGGTRVRCRRESARRLRLYYLGALWERPRCSTSRLRHCAGGADVVLWRLRRPYLPRIKTTGIPVDLPSAEPGASAPSARAGRDIIVAQSAEAGGHGARRATLPLVPAVVDHGCSLRA